MKKFTGGCLCGAVRYACEGDVMVAGHCHCEACRRTSGTGHASHMAVQEAGWALSGTTKAYARAADSGNLVSRHFCPECGAPIFSTNAGMPGMVFVRASSLDDLEIFSPSMHVWASKAASWDQPVSLPAFATMPNPAEFDPNQAFNKS